MPHQPPHHQSNRLSLVKCAIRVGGHSFAFDAIAFETRPVISNAFHPAARKTVLRRLDAGDLRARRVGDVSFHDRNN